MCANCGHAAPGNFCPSCGQKTHIETPTLFEFIHEYLHHYVALEGTLTRTLWTLISRPGALTAEYIAGRRQRYIKPLQLYLTISFIFFVLMGLFGASINTRPLIAGPNADTAEIIRQEAEDGITIGANPLDMGMGSSAEGTLHGKEAVSKDKKETAGGKDGKPQMLVTSDIPAVKAWAGRLGTLLEEQKAHPAETMAHLQKEGMHRLPYAVFGVMPLLAFLLWLFYYRRHLVYGVHLVFVLHLHAFAFLLFMLWLLPFMSEDLLGWIFVAYFVLALRRVYGGRWIPQICRALLMLSIYFVFVGLAIALLLVSLV